ncbi:hypothetical protein [Mesorhizobium sp. f-mel]
MALFQDLKPWMRLEIAAQDSDIVVDPRHRLPAAGTDEEAEAFPFGGWTPDRSKRRRHGQQ